MKHLEIRILRVFGNELSQPVMDSDVSVELHNNRAQALHDIFDNNNELEVLDWGQTDDDRPHEMVAIVVGIGATALTNTVLIPAGKYIFEKLADKVVDTVLENAVAWILAKFKKKKEENKIGDFEIRLPDGVILYTENLKKGTKIKFRVDGKMHEVEF